MTKLARASALQFAVNIGQTVVGALVTIYIVRQLGFGVFGQYALAMAVANWLMIPTVGIRGATMKRMSEGENRDRYYTAGLSLQLVAALLFIAAIFAARRYVNSYAGFNAVLYVAGLFVTISTGRFFLAALRGENRVEVSSLLEGGWSITRSLAQLAFVLAGAGIAGLVKGEILAATFSLIVAFFATRRSFARPVKADFYHLYEFGRYGWFSNMKQMSYSWMDTIVLGLFVTSALVGAYEVAWRVSALFMLLPKAISKVVFPSISQRAVIDQHEGIEQIVGRALSFGGVIAIPGVVGAIFLGREILGIYGASPEQLAIATPILIVLGIGRIVESYEELLLTTLSALDFPDRAFRIGIIFTILNVGLNLALVWTVGVIGAAVATSLSIGISGLLAIRAVPDDVSISVSFQAIGAQVASAALMGGVLWVVISIRPAASIPLVLGYVFFGALVYTTSLLLFSHEARSRAQQLLDESIGVL